MDKNEKREELNRTKKVPKDCDENILKISRWLKIFFALS